MAFFMAAKLFVLQDHEETNPLPEEEYFSKVHDFREPSLHYTAPAATKGK
jgi:hypothetical protein